MFHCCKKQKVGENWDTDKLKDLIERDDGIIGAFLQTNKLNYKMSGEDSGVIKRTRRNWGTIPRIAAKRKKAQNISDSLHRLEKNAKHRNEIANVYKISTIILSWNYLTQRLEDYLQMKIRSNNIKLNRLSINWVGHIRSKLSGES